MARDYRRTHSTRPSKRYTKPAPKNTAGGFKWTFIGILVGLLIAIAIFWEYAPSLLHAKASKHQLPPIQSHHAAIKKDHPTADSTAGQSHTPQFDFYTLLPKAQVDASSTTPTPTAQTPVAKKPIAPATVPTTTNAVSPTKAANTPTAPTPSHTADTTSTLEAPPTTTKPTTPSEAIPNHTGKYMLQVASVKNYSEADRLKAQLSMLGLSVSIQKSTVDGEVWNRIFAGPFSTKQQALEKQQTLRENNISSMVVKQ
ncbi:MAG TPA: SPOR domain-containing protein [Gammaproteobacteria bacterium]|nr:SPOR domain-containing protein [Gammaproteobacteria bacterium]